MVGILASVLGGALQGGGNAIQVQARDDELARQRERLEKIQADRQMAIEMMRQKHNLEAAKVEHGYRTENTQLANTLALERDKQNNEQADQRLTKTQGFSAQQTQAQNEFLAGESAKDREARLRIANISHASANQGTLQVDDEGNVRRIVGTKSSPVIDSTTGEPMKAKRGVSEATLKLVDTYMVVAKDPMSTPEEKAAALKTAQQLLSGGKPDSTPQAAPWTGLPEDKRSAILRRLDSYRSGDPSRLSAAIEEARNLGVPVDILQNMTPKEKPKAVLRDSDKPGFAQEPNLSERDLEMQKQMDADRARREKSAARASEIKSMSLQRINSMSSDELKSLLDKFSLSEFSLIQRQAITERMR